MPLEEHIISKRLNSDSSKKQDLFLASCLVTLLILIHSQIWFGNGSLSQLLFMKNCIIKQQSVNTVLKIEIRSLYRNINQIKNNSLPAEIEYRIRRDMHLMEKGEIFAEVHFAQQES